MIAGMKPFLLCNERLQDALDLYTSVFPDSKVRSVARSWKYGPVQSAEFTVGGQPFVGVNGGPHLSFSEGASFFVDCADQAEVDRTWDALLRAGSKPTRGGWIRDPFGFSWQIVPRRFTEMIRDRDPRRVKAVIDAMMTMERLDVAALEKAYAGG